MRIIRVGSNFWPRIKHVHICNWLDMWWINITHVPRRLATAVCSWLLASSRCSQADSCHSTTDHESWPSSTKCSPKLETCPTTHQFRKSISVRWLFEPWSLDISRFRCWLQHVETHSDSLVFFPSPHVVDVPLTSTTFTRRPPQGPWRHCNRSGPMLLTPGSDPSVSAAASTWLPWRWRRR